MLLVHPQTDQFHIVTHDHNVVLRPSVKFPLSHCASEGPQSIQTQLEIIKLKSENDVDCSDGHFTLLTAGGWKP